MGSVITVPPSAFPPLPSAFPPLPPALADRLAAAGIGEVTGPMAAWLRLREAEGRRVTVIDLYELAAAQRGITPKDLPLADRRALAMAAISVVFPGFSLVPGSERTGDPLEVARYDPAWPEQFARWRATFARALGRAAIRVEHFGSTAVPGLAAKPVIDVLIGVADVADDASYLPPLEATGLQLRSVDDARRFLRPLPGRPRDVHVHVCTAGSDWEREHLLFRDYLRAHPAACDRYARAKRDAIRAWHDDRWAYTEAKTGVILDILDAAERWAAVTAWALPPRIAPPSDR